MIMEDPFPAPQVPPVPAINIIGPGAWMNKRLTSCELVI